MTLESVLFIPYRETLDLLSVEEAMQVCEDVYRMHGRGAVQWPKPLSWKLDAPAPWHNHWHVKGAFLPEIPVTGVRMYNYFDDGVRNTVGRLECARYILLTDPSSGHARAIVEEHWSYAIRSAAAAVVGLRWLGPENPRVLGLVGVGTMGRNVLRCVNSLYQLEKVVCTSRSPETRNTFAEEWSGLLGIDVEALDSVEEVVRASDIGVGGTTSTDIVAREEWVKPGAVYISLARREMDPAGWSAFDKVVIDNWDANMMDRTFVDMVGSGLFSREKLHGEIGDVVEGTVKGRESAEERILIHTTGLVSQDIAICHHIFEKAKRKGIGIALPPTDG